MVDSQHTQFQIEITGDVFEVLRSDAVWGWWYLFVAAQLVFEEGDVFGSSSTIHLNLDQLLHQTVSLHTQLLALKPAAANRSAWLNYF